MARQILSTALMRHAMQKWFRLTRSMTFGVRGMVLDSDHRVLLVCPRYSESWTLPGGGVERRETALAALRRELEEEAAITLRGRPQLFGVYSNERHFRGDHVALYVVREFELGTFRASMEVREVRFYGLGALPQVTDGTLRRIEEVMKGITPAEYW